jgi:hypothetical protein
VPAHESLHFLKGNGAIVVGIHCLEYALVSRLKLLQRELPVSVSVHQTENYSHHHWTSDVATSIPLVVPVIMSHHSGGGGGRGGRGGGGLGGWTVLNAERSTRYSSNSLQLVQPGFN